MYILIKIPATNMFPAHPNYEAPAVLGTAMGLRLQRLHGLHSLHGRCMGLGPGVLGVEKWP